MQADWTKFTKRIPVSADISTIYKAWTIQEELEKWFLRKAVFIKPDNSLRQRNEPIEKGDRYEWFWHGYPDTTFEKKEILEANGKDFLQFSANDMFNSGSDYRFDEKIPIPGAKMYGNLNFGMVAFKLTYTHNFGNRNLKDKRERNTGAENELQRVHN